jgi:signal transduction histidine kinase
MQIFRWRSISAQIILAVLLPLTAGAIFITFYSQSLHHDAMQQMVGERNQRTVEVLAADLDRIYSSRVDTLIKASNPGELSSRSDRNYTKYFFLDSEGNFTTGPGSSLENEMLEKIVQSNRENWASEVPGKVLVTTWLDDAADKQWVIMSASKVEGNVVGDIIDLDEEMDQFSGWLAQPGKLSIQLYDQSHSLIYEAGRSPLETHLVYHPGVLTGLDGKSGVLYSDENHDHEQGVHVISYAPVKTTGWVIVLDEAWEDVSSSQLNTTQNMPLILIPFILLAVAALWVIVRQVVLPLQKLEKQTQALGEGDFSAIIQPVGGIAEVRSLQSRLADMAENLHKARRSLQGYVGSITRGVEDERKRLSRDLHDDTLQSLIALKHRVQTDQSADPAANLQVIQKVIDDIRGIVRGLRPVILEDLGLAAALENLCRQIERETGIKTMFQVSGEERRYSGEVELAFFRIAQEGLMNAQKHASASLYKLLLKFEQQEFRMEIIDNGKGFIVPDKFDELVAEGHFGLIGIVERASLIQAEIDISSRLGSGTRIKVNYKAPNLIS